ncbi:MAG: FAD-containing monooxygenase EthA [Moraxellaceae bacterium]|jgi:cation diffusion facilitator CzcD-associated flavoprotein CzcO|nr:FAD-containing monooxygenase EthA [Moraxellaceae bacterium]
MPAEHVDVLIIGAGLSGIGAGCHLKRECPNKSFAILEGRSASGGTWDLFRYPGIRSDSDMFTLGYSFKPWTNNKSIADGPDIRSYIREAAAEHGVDKKIRYGIKVKRASWSSTTSSWTVEAEKTDTGELVTYSAGFIMSCTGYYNYEKGYEPEFAGRDSFKGQVIHPQKWPEDLDYSGKKVVVIGSGATAVTLVPAMTDKAALVTMLQRSPTYVLSVPLIDPMVQSMRKFLPEKAVYRLTRARNVGITLGLYKFSRAKPQAMRRFVLSQIKRKLGPDYDMKHFTPSYNPWDERLCAVPNGDMFKAIRKGKAAVVTDHIERFDETGILLKSGQHLEADIIITATGLDLQMMGGMQVSVDGKPYNTADKMYYKGIMFEDLPNFGMTFGYTNASWTLKADLTSEYVCRLLKLMDKKGVRQVTPRNHDVAVHQEDMISLASGYIQRAAGKLPKQGNKAPWKLNQNYTLDLMALRFGKMEDGVLEFASPVRGKAAQLARA